MTDDTRRNDKENASEEDKAPLSEQAEAETAKDKSNFDNRASENSATENSASENSSESSADANFAENTRDENNENPSADSGTENDLPGTQAILVDTPAKPNEVPPKATSKEAEPPPAEEPEPTKQDRQAAGKSKLKWWLLGTALLILLGLAGMSYFLYQEAQKLAAEQAQEIDALAQELSTLRSATRDTLSELQSDTSANRSAVEGLSDLESNVKTRLSDLEARTSAQAKRLLAMSDTSREDWLLAEAEYLLKLANQRVRIERSAEGSEALLEEADAILRDLEDPSLHSLRRAIAKDLAALRLMNKIDVEGIYLTLVSMAEKVDALPLRSDIITRSKEKVASTEPAPQGELSFGQQLKRSFREFLTTFNSYIAIDSHSEKPEVLAPDSAVYIQQNMRLMLERAQLALLREQQEIYEQSIEQAQAWALRYYPSSEPRRRFVETMENLKAKDVVQKLPDISDSLNLLHEYIENLHSLKGASLSLPTPRQRELG